MRDSHSGLKGLDPLTEEQTELAAKYASRLSLLTTLSYKLESKAREALDGVPHIERVTFRVKDGSSFARKCLPVAGDRPYRDPLSEVEDQVGGRVLVFFNHDLAVAEQQLSRWFTGIVEAKKKRPSSASEFGYESDHYIVVIDEHLKPEGWADSNLTLPTTFELQIRTLFMHAWAEPQHDLGYKGREVLKEHQRMLAWVASSAWGADRMFEDLWGAVSSYT